MCEHLDDLRAAAHLLETAGEVAPDPPPPPQDVLKNTEFRTEWMTSTHSSLAPFAACTSKLRGFAFVYVSLNSPHVAGPRATTSISMFKVLKSTLV